MKDLVIRLALATILVTAMGCSKDDLPDPAYSPYLDYGTKTELELPFDEEWWVFWGGRSVGENYHAAYREQRFALDLVQRINGRNYQGNGSRNEDYHCFGKRLNAPGAGKIIAMGNDVHDNVPGQFNREVPEGNHVIIDHENGEFSFMAHFKKGSIIVAVGDTVLKGQELGKTGNSGNSSEPHLHYHLQSTSDKGNGFGLPAQFLNYYANGVFMANGEPSRNQYIGKSR